MATIQDVAKEAGISIATVSRALNNPDLVSADTRERVMEAVRNLNYYPNEKAKMLSSKSQNLSIGVIIPYLTAFYFGELYRGISRTAQQHNINLILHELKNENSRRERLMDALVFSKQHRVDGVILASRHIPADYDEAIERLNIPIVLVLASHEQTKLPAFKVDDLRASFDAVGYLITRGHRRIGMISAPLEDKVVGEPRFLGYKNAMEFYQLPFDDLQVAYGNVRYDDGYSAMKKLLAAREQTGITAVFAASDEMAIGAMRCIYDNGLKVPDDISVIGYDNLTISNMVTPKLTTVSQPFEDIGAEGVEYLVKLMKDPEQTAAKGTHYMPYQIIERESVARPNF